ncbi:zf-HC2 domain-containing protein, partial [Streptomyces sp. NPDC052301]|uniref:zf-HC2 domain-containing protein n=1 Tax=Streptomyces sp. NPDC052301 TaxID=3365687 RepID=UPI0037D5D701
MTNDNTHIWHLSADRVARYTDGSLPEPDAWSLEKHVEGCGGCAARVSEAVRGTAAGAVLAEIRASVLETVLGTAVENGREQGPVGNGREQGPVGNGREQGPVGNGREQGPVGNGRE